MAGSFVSRVLALASLVLAIVVVTVVLLGGSGPYRMTARFVDAGQLVKGDLVEVAGRKVGTVSDLSVSSDGLADVELSIGDDGVAPLHEGTTATIRTVGLASVTNRFVELSPGPPDAPAIRDGSVLPTTRTRGVVDLDMLLDAIDPTTRRHLRTLVREAAVAFRAPAADQVNAGLAYLDPALAQTAALGGEIVRDQASLKRLITTGAATVGALASRQDDLGAGLDSAAAALTQVASRRTELADLLDRAPPLLRQARTTLGHLNTALPLVDPVLRDLHPAIAPLARLLRDVVPVARDAAPAIAEIRALLPQAKRVLAQVPALDRAASPALTSTTGALRGVLPIVAGLRPYTPDLIAGLFNGFGGAVGSTYDANGHYLRISLEGSPASLPGILSPTPGPGFEGYRSGLDARCPGAAEEPVPDGSNPWIPSASLCDPADGMG
ncbi:MAG: phospholipid/cholesterol/gamma-HCH transport system substrate-binding protein [Solirubrobacteraceae bacterium]|nr:phospholipid/cholesterol/gamma-HCH transport system substrate-binding protein [Solirubrobacteraceae bacterium]